jgi:polysaccharide export outer membrane protein
MRVLAVALIALSTARASALAQDAPAKPEQPPAAATAAATNYTIGPSDVLQIIVWKEPELTRDVTVRFDGKITVPLLGDLQAAGRTPVEVADSLTQGLKHFIDAPRVTVGIGQANSSRFYVVGLVIRSGEFPLAGHTTVLQGLALAGGFKEFAKTDGIVIVRRDQSIVPVNYKRIADGKDVAQNVLLAPGDTIVVP